MLAALETIGGGALTWPAERLAFCPCLAGSRPPRTICRPIHKNEKPGIPRRASVFCLMAGGDLSSKIIFSLLPWGGQFAILRVIAITVSDDTLALDMPVIVDFLRSRSGLPTAREIADFSAVSRGETRRLMDAGQLPSVELCASRRVRWTDAQQLAANHSLGLGGKRPT